MQRSTQLNKSKFPRIPSSDARKILFKKIRDLYRLKYDYEDICSMLNVSRITVFFALNKEGRAKVVKIKNRKD